MRPVYGDPENRTAVGNSPAETRLSSIEATSFCVLCNVPSKNASRVSDHALDQRDSFLCKRKEQLAGKEAFLEYRLEIEQILISQNELNGRNHQECLDEPQEESKDIVYHRDVGRLHDA